MSELKTLEKGKDWSVRGSSVAGTGRATGELKGLQADLNRFVGLTKVEGVAVDGLVGARTVAAVKAVYDAVVAKNPLLAATPFPIPDTAEEVATYAPHIRSWLSSTAADALGAARQRRYVFGEGKEWNTRESIAYGAGPVHEEFKGLQADLNRFAGAAGFAAIQTDGFIGPKTAAAVTAIYKQVVARNPLLAATPFPVPDTKEEVAEYAQHIRGWLKETASKALSIPDA
jgi:lysozyme family protein